MTESRRATSEFERTLHVANTDLMTQYNETVTNYLEQNKIPVIIKRYKAEADFILYLKTRSGLL